MANDFLDEEGRMKMFTEIAANINTVIDDYAKSHSLKDVNILKHAIMMSLSGGTVGLDLLPLERVPSDV